MPPRPTPRPAPAPAPNPPTTMERLKTPGGMEGLGRRGGPLWKGPAKDGVTYSLLCKFLNDREKFRLLVVEGIKPHKGFDHKIEFGQMWHLAEEYSRKGPPAEPWEKVVQKYATALCCLHPTQQNDIDRWYRVVRMMFPHYVRWWEDHPDEKGRTPALQEYQFRIPYSLPSGRVVVLRGKVDAIDLVDEGSGPGPGPGYWVQENKTKGDVNALKLEKQLSMDLQTMLYVLVADSLRMPEHGGRLSKNYPVRGVRYNVIKRPGYKVTKGDGDAAGHVRRIEPLIRDAHGPEAGLARGLHEYFHRWNIPVRADDLNDFRRQTLDPILEQLCDWWAWVSYAHARRKDPFTLSVGEEYQDQTLRDALLRGHAVHWRHPYGIWNPANEGVFTDLDQHLIDGSMLGLTRTDNLYPELDP